MLLSASVSVTFILLFVASSFVLNLVQTFQDAPYMDEIFHVPQAQHYCAFNFTTWDPMITTLPGLYLSSLVLLFPVASLQGLSLSSVCTTQALRACNVVYTLGNFLLLYGLTRKLSESFQDKRLIALRQVLNAAVLSIFPVLYFFTWMYYTDPGSTFFTLLMYLCCLSNWHFLAAFSGAIAVLFRQTNIVWVLFCMGLIKADIIEKQIRLYKKKGNLKTLGDYEMLKLTLQTVFGSIGRYLEIAYSILVNSFWYFCVVICFAMFVYMNNGIVVGDRSNHQVALNFPQILYFLLVSAGFSFFHFTHPRHIINFLYAMVRHPIKVLLFTVLVGYLIKSFTIEHKYTLSDNRHYTFYVWSKIFRRFAMARYALIPVYMFSLYQWYCLTAHRGFFWRITICTCILACLIPQALLEFRYFIIPFYILRLNMKVPSLRALILELLFYVTLNAFTVYMFLMKPFYWPDDSQPQRFMW